MAFYKLAAIFDSVFTILRLFHSSPEAPIHKGSEDLVIRGNAATKQFIT
jgi:hypothetical protein